MGELLRGARRLNLRPAAIDGCQLTAIPLGSLEVLLLDRGWIDVALMLSLKLLRTRADGNAAIAAVVADTVVVVVDDGYVVLVDVSDVGAAEVADAGVVEEAVAAPFATFITCSEVAESVVDSAIEPDMRTPVTVMEVVEATLPAPERRGPEETALRRQDPCAGYPVVALRTIGPVARGPDVAVAGADGLDIDRKHRWCEANLDDELTK